MTIEQVKRELPNVKVRIGRKVATGRVSGRLNKFATVSVTNEGTLHRNTPIWMDWQFSWEAIAHAVTTGEPLNVA